MKSLLLTCLLMPVAFLHAQDSSSKFEIKDYKYRTPGFRALSLDFYLAANTSKSELKGAPSYTSSSIAVNPSQFNFYKISSTDSRIAQSNYNFTLYGNYNSNKSNNVGYIQKSGSAGFSWQVRHQYFRKKNWFWELGNKLATSATISQFKDDPVYDKDQNFGVDETVTLGTGKGRIENVQDAQMALFILNDLEQLGLLTNSYTGEQAHELAKIITDINNTRVFDFRKRRIYELQRIDSFLKNSGLVVNSDIRHFTTVNDNWMFAFNPQRQHGNQWYLRVKPSINLMQQKEKSTLGVAIDETIYLRAMGVMPEIGFESQKAKSLYWQRSFNINLNYFRSSVKEERKNKLPVPAETETEYGQLLTELTSAYSIGYFPNTRTMINGTLGASASYMEGFGYDQALIIRSYLTFGSTYFLGYRTRLNASLGINFESRDFESLTFSGKVNTTSIGGQVSFTHFIF